VQLDQTVKAGDPICNIDITEAAFAISKSHAQIANLEGQISNYNAQISGFEAQKKNLDTENTKQRDSLTTQKNNLTKELEALAAQQSSANVTKSEQIRLQNIILEQNQADIERLQADYDNFKLLYDGGVIPEIDLETSEKALSAAIAQRDQNLQQLAIIENGSAQTNDAYFAASRGALEEQISGVNNSLSKDYTAAMKEYYNAQIQAMNAQIESVGAQIAAVNVDIDTQRKFMEDSTVLSIADGVVIDLPASKSNMASAASPLAVLAVGRSLVTVYISTNDINHIEIGKEVELILKRREGDETYKGTIVRIEEKAEIKISSLGVEERKVKVFIQPNERPELFQNGYDVDVKFLVFQKENALVLPKTAIFKDGDVNRVWEISEGVLKKTDVTKGLELNNDIIIENGLVAGSVVVSDATLSELKEGAKATASE
jgi:HlyD family secretion protein